MLDESEWEFLEASYDGELHQNDEALGQFWAALRGREIANKSLLILTSDHGEGFNEHPRQRVWHDLPYETILHVPLIIRRPGGTTVGRITAAVRTIDIYPTVLEEVGLKVDTPINGASLMSLATGHPDDLPRPLLGASQYGDGVIFMRDAGHKFFYSRLGEARAEAYDLVADPGEQQNLVSTDPDAARQLSKRLNELLVVTTLATVSGGSRPMSEEQLRRLRSLGYVN